MNKQIEDLVDFQKSLLQYQGVEIYASSRRNAAVISRFLDWAQRKADSSNDPEAKYWLARHALIQSDFKRHKHLQVLEMLEQNAAVQHPPSMTLLARIDMGEFDIIPPGFRQQDRGLSLLQRAVKIGYGPAFTILAKRQEQQNRRWYQWNTLMRLARKFSATGYAGGDFYLARQKMKAKNLTAAQKRRILAMLEKAFAGIDKLPHEDHALANQIRFHLGACYYNGYGNAPDRQKGITLIGIVKSIPEAKAWLEERQIDYLGNPLEPEQETEQETKKNPQNADNKSEEDQDIPLLFIKAKKKLEERKAKIDHSFSASEIDALMAPIDGMIGLDALKKELRQLINMVLIQKERRRASLKISPVNLHMVFSGNPGTGKTTAARLIGDIFKGLGLLEKGHIVEVSRENLVGEYIGWTEAQTLKAIEDATGGILFIDEAHTLSSTDSARDFGWEAIDVLSKAMEDRRDQFVVIATGYEAEMKNFLRASPGLASRFSYQIPFKDYTADEMLKIFENLCTENQYILSSVAREKLRTGLTAEKKKAHPHFGNGRYVRQLFEKTVRLQAERLIKKAQKSTEDLMQLEPFDIPFDMQVTADNITYLK